MTKTCIELCNPGHYFTYLKKGLNTDDKDYVFCVSECYSS